jgi:hypothetical protein
MGRKRRLWRVEGEAVACRGRDDSDWAEEETKWWHVEEETTTSRVTEVSPCVGYHDRKRLGKINRFLENKD